MIYRIGQLAKEAGLTVRTLRFYDRIGLLKPSAVTEAGYRIYDKQDVVRLHHITTLKQLGFTLSDIGSVLEAGDEQAASDKWLAAIRMQIAEIRKEQERLLLLDRLLHTTMHTLELRGDVEAGELLRFIQLVRSSRTETRKDEILADARSKHFTESEVAVLQELPVLDAEDPRTLKWVRLLRDIHANLAEPPDSDISRRLAVRVMELSTEFFGGNDDLVDKYWDWVKPEPGTLEKVLGLDAETMAYIERITEPYWREDGEKQGGISHGSASE